MSLLISLFTLYYLLSALSRPVCVSLCVTKASLFLCRAQQKLTKTKRPPLFVRGGSEVANDIRRGGKNIGFIILYIRQGGGLGRGSGGGVRGGKRNEVNGTE